MDLSARTRLQEELRRADRRSMFRAAAAEIAHELSTPLNVVQARAQLLSYRESDEEIDANIKVIVDQIQKVASCLRQMVDAASGEGPQMEEVHLPLICDETCQLVAPLAESRRVQMAVASDVELVNARIDRVKTLQILTNVVANGIDALPEGGTIEISALTTTIERVGDPAVAPGKYVQFEVRDRGRGFDTSALGMQLAKTPMGTAPKLGLFVCRNVLKELGGWMTVESEPGRGATIQLFVPDGENS